MMLEVRSVESPLVLKEGFQVLLAGEGMGMEPVLEAGVVGYQVGGGVVAGGCCGRDGGGLGLAKGSG